ncbi:MAG TPA: hypothetical protein PK678_11310, partial [Ferruginibacter sp.]|nr:hypothetical protein [Ferruginibacter sp.]
MKHNDVVIKPAIDILNIGEVCFNGVGQHDNDIAHNIYRAVEIGTYNGTLPRVNYIIPYTLYFFTPVSLVGDIHLYTAEYNTITERRVKAVHPYSIQPAFITIVLVFDETGIDQHIMACQCSYNLESTIVSQLASPDDHIINIPGIKLVFDIDTCRGPVETVVPCFTGGVKIRPVY